MLVPGTVTKPGLCLAGDDRARRCFSALAVIAACALGVGLDATHVAAETTVPHAKPSTVQQPVDAYTAAEKTTQGNIGRPYVLPQASRARIHECGVEWQAMKMSGEATDKIWRVFAAVCLAAPSDKTPSPSDSARPR